MNIMNKPIADYMSDTFPKPQIKKIRMKEKKTQLNLTPLGVCVFSAYLFSS